MRAYLKFKWIFLFLWLGGVIASSVHSIQPRVTWEDGITTEELPRSGALWPKLWGILLITNWCRRAQATVPVPFLSRRSWASQRLQTLRKSSSVVSVSVHNSRLLPWFAWPIQWSKSCLPWVTFGHGAQDINRKQTSTGCLKPNSKFFDLSPLGLLIGFCSVCVGNQIDGNLVSEDTNRQKSVSWTPSYILPINFKTNNSLARQPSRAS